MSCPLPVPGAEPGTPDFEFFSCPRPGSQNGMVRVRRSPLLSSVPMDVEMAFLALAAGSQAEREHAIDSLGRRYLPRLAAALAGQFKMDEGCAATGAAEALLDFFELSDAKRAENDLCVEASAWRWLLRRARSRAQDYWRQQHALLSAVPKKLRDEIEAFDLLDLDLSDPSAPDPPASVILTAERERVKPAAMKFLRSLDDPIDRGIFLHDLVMKYELLTQEEVEAFDEELISNSHELYTDERLKKRRQRLLQKLREFYKRFP